MRSETTESRCSPGGPQESIAVFGGACTYSQEQIVLAYRLGRSIGSSGRILMTGATTGLPYAAALGAKDSGGTVVGISPASGAREHVETFGKPLACCDVVIYTDMGVEGRSVVLVHSATAAIIVGGEFGTLGEFSMACTAGNMVIGVLAGSGGMADCINSLPKTSVDSAGVKILFDEVPEALVNKVCREMNERAATQDEVFTHECFRSAEPGSDIREVIASWLAEGEGE